jgi:hypothetical protein
MTRKKQNVIRIDMIRNNRIRNDIFYIDHMKIAGVAILDMQITPHFWLW